jgi:excisionase family DNA binding protein
MEKVSEHNEGQVRRIRTQIMTADEVAKYLGVHTITVYRLIKDTDIPAFKLKGQWRFKKDLLDEWIMKNMRERKDLDKQA